MSTKPPCASRDRSTFPRHAGSGAAVSHHVPPRTSGNALRASPLPSPVCPGGGGRGCARGSSLCQKGHRVRQRDTPLFGNVDKTCRPYPRGRQRARPGRQEHMLAVFTCVVPAGTSSACASAARCTSGRESTCSGGSETRAPSLFRCSFSLGAVASENFFGSDV